MRLLLDTQVLLWQLDGSDRLGPTAQSTIRSVDDSYVSVLSFAEIGIKASAGKLKVPSGIGTLITARRVLGLSADHGLALATLPVHHKDPFDRLLIAQAMTEGLTIVTSDRAFAKYDVDVIDARS